jgi:hypothetical protein
MTSKFIQAPAAVVMIRPHRFHSNPETAAGNAIELSAGNRRILAISSRAAASLTAEQTMIIEESARIVELSVPTIELAGGSVRCMLAGIHLARRY